MIATTAFIKLARAQATAFGQPNLPIAVIPHPLGSRSRAEIRELAEKHVAGIVDLVCQAGSK